MLPYIAAPWILWVWDMIELIEATESLVNIVLSKVLGMTLTVETVETLRQSNRESPSSHKEIGLYESVFVSHS